MPKLLTRDQVVAKAKKAGFTDVKTLAGAVSLDDWKPYGKTEHKTIGFYIDGSQIKERPLNDAWLPYSTVIIKSRMLAGEVRKLEGKFVFGVWVLLRSSLSTQGWPLDQAAEVGHAAMQFKRIGYQCSVVKDGEWWRIKTFKEEAS